MSEPVFDGISSFDLEEFERTGYSDLDALGMSRALLVDAIPCLNSIYPDLTDAQKSLVKYAILEMAKYIKIEFQSFDTALSPFQSETIGSWSYSKASASVKSGQASGVPGFDRAVSLLGGLCSVDGDGIASVTSERVFQPGIDSYLSDRLRKSNMSPQHDFFYTVYPWRH